MTSKINATLLLAFATTLLVNSSLSSAADEPVKQAPLQLQSLKVELPDDDNTYPDGAGADIANSYCAICHSADMVTAQPAFAKDKWKKIVTKMQKEFGCPVPDENVDELAAYLYGINSAKNGVTAEKSVSK